LSTVDHAQAAAQIGPQRPNLTFKDLVWQFWVDVFGKEVQSATTYSYVWMADQSGHVCLGIVLTTLLATLARWIGIMADWGIIGGALLCSIVVSYWEFRAYRKSVKDATGLFPLDRELLRANAIIAAGYMVLGAGIAFFFHQSDYWLVLGLIVLGIIGLALAPPWLRQKIIWQRAGLPFLFRLANAQHTVADEVAKQLQKLIEAETPSATAPRQVIVGGPIGSGRTAIAAGIGTEFAFKKATVRYVSLAALLEFAAQPADPDYADDAGPDNIRYWRWSQAQVLIIDDIGPLIAAKHEAGQADLKQFELTLTNGLGSIAAVLAKCHTVWVIGDLRANGQSAMKGRALDDFAGAISGFCGAKLPALVVELSNETAADAGPLAPRKTAVVPQVAHIREVPHQESGIGSADRHIAVDEAGQVMTS